MVDILNSTHPQLGGEGTVLPALGASGPASGSAGGVSTASIAGVEGTLSVARAGHMDVDELELAVSKPEAKLATEHGEQRHFVQVGCIIGVHKPLIHHLSNNKANKVGPRLAGG